MILVQFDAKTGEQDMEFTKWVESLTQEELQVEVLKLHEERKALERIEFNQKSIEVDIQSALNNRN